MHIEWRIPQTLVRPLLGAGAIIMAAVAGLWWMSAPVQESPMTTKIIRTVPSTSTLGVMVDVVGAVRRPGVVRLPAGARVIDAVAAAGGLLPHQKPVVNMARPVVDGEQIVIGAPTAADAAGGSAASTPGRIDINSASAAQLEDLPGIGPVLAARIVSYRTAHGPFRHTRDLLDVPGIGDAKFAELSAALNSP